MLVAMLESSGPHAEFFHVVAKHGDTIGVSSGCVAHIFDDVFDLSEWHQIAQRLLAGEKAHTLSAILGLIGAKKFLRLKSRGQKVKIVDQRVIYLGGSQHRRKLRFPNAFGKPDDGWPFAKMFFDVRREALNLFVLVFGRDDSQNRLVKSATNHFHFPALDPGAE